MRIYKKSKGLFIVFKMALICYLVIFGISYITSDTSANFSNQSEVSQTITAGVWENPVNQCGEENEEDAVSGDEINVDCGNEEEEEEEEEESMIEDEEDKSSETDIEKEDKSDLDTGDEEEHQNPEEDEQKQPDDEGESVNESDEKEPNDSDSIESRESEDSSD